MYTHIYVRKGRGKGHTCKPGEPMLPGALADRQSNLPKWQKNANYTTQKIQIHQPGKGSWRVSGLPVEAGRVSLKQQLLSGCGFTRGGGGAGGGNAALYFAPRF